MFQWYVVIAGPNREAKVKRDILQRASRAGVSDLFRRIVIPSEQVMETVAGEKRQKERKLMPGYVLVNMRMSDESWLTVKNTPGVLGFAGSGERPVPMTQADVAHMLGQQVEGSKLKPSGPLFATGEAIEVTGGPLAGMSGTVIEANPDSQKLRVELMIFDRPTPTELEFGQVKKLAG
jgi:transcriptional antiterminator NusG